MSATPEQIAVELENFASVCAKDRWNYVWDYVDDLLAAAALIRTSVARIQSLESRVGVLEGALEPFARAARSIDVDPPGDHEPSHGRGSVTAGDLRRARAALAGDA